MESRARNRLELLNTPTEGWTQSREDERKERRASKWRNAVSKGKKIAWEANKEKESCYEMANISWLQIIHGLEQQYRFGIYFVDNR